MSWVIAAPYGTCTAFYTTSRAMGWWGTIDQADTYTSEEEATSCMHKAIFAWRHKMKVMTYEEAQAIAVLEEL